MAKKVVFLFGGPGSEHEVSVATAQSALPQFPEDYRILPVFITQENKWVCADDFVAPADAWQTADSLRSKSGQPLDIALDEIESKQPDVIFLGLHGQFGEDGTLQALLESRGLAFTGSDSEASALAIDKTKVFQILQDEGLSVPEYLEITPQTSQSDIQSFIDFHSLPMVVFPADQGSSVGVSIVRDAYQLSDAIGLAGQWSERVLLSKYISGRELSAGLLVTGPNELISLPPTELIPGEGHDFFDFTAKYTAGHTEEQTPPNLPTETIQRIQGVARQVHKTIGADGYSRVDMILGDDNKLYVLEINTLPGLTATSILPQQAKAQGMSFTQLLATICDNIDRSDREYLEFTTQSTE